MIEMQMLVAPLSAILIGGFAAWNIKRSTAASKERAHDLNETRKAMIAHYDAMDKIIAAPEVPNSLKQAMMDVTRTLDDVDFAKHACDVIINGKAKAVKNSPFLTSLDEVKQSRPDLFVEIETAMASAMFITLLRWPETSRQFKHFVITSMINEEREVALFTRVSELAKRHSGSLANGISGSNGVAGVCAA